MVSGGRTDAVALGHCENVGEGIAGGPKRWPKRGQGADKAAQSAVQYDRDFEKSR